MADRDTDLDFAMRELTGWTALQLDFPPVALPGLAATIRDACGLNVPMRCGDVTGEGDLHAMRIAPGRLRLVADSRAVSASALSAVGSQAAMTEITHGQRRYRLSGARLFEVLAKGVALDFESPAFAPGRCAQTQLHRVPVLLHRLGVRVLELYAPRSFAQSVEEWLVDAALPLGGIARAPEEELR